MIISPSRPSKRSESRRARFPFVVGDVRNVEQAGILSSRDSKGRTRALSRNIEGGPPGSRWRYADYGSPALGLLGALLRLDQGRGEERQQDLVMAGQAVAAPDALGRTLDDIDPRAIGLDEIEVRGGEVR